MSQYTTPNLTIDAANGTSYAYRRYGKPGTVPVVFFQHFRGNLDNWDRALVDGIASEREVILYDASGVGLSTGAVPTSFREFGRDALAFIDALGLTEVDLFGFSIGGFVAQEVALQRPHLVRRVILAGAGPQGGREMHGTHNRKGMSDGAHDNRHPDRRPRARCGSARSVRGAGAGGKHDDEWPRWYAEHMTHTLAEDGYRLVAGAGASRDE